MCQTGGYPSLVVTTSDFLFILINSITETVILVGVLVLHKTLLHGSEDRYVISQFQFMMTQLSVITTARSDITVVFKNLRESYLYVNKNNNINYHVCSHIACQVIHYC